MRRRRTLVAMGRRAAGGQAGCGGQRLWLTTPCDSLTPLFESTQRRQAEPAGAGLLNRCGFTDHAIERFATRAGLPTTDRRIIEPLIRELLVREGKVVDRRPRWSRSRRGADLYLQLGEWMLFIGCRDRSGSDRYSIVTVVNGERNTTWNRALRLGYIRTPPPSHMLDSEPRARGLLATLRRIHRVLRRR